MLNHNTGTKLHFSGVESRKLLDTFTQFKVPYIQVSYYYLRRVFGDAAEAESYLKHFDSVLIDHGLIYHKYKSEPERKQFLEDYYDYLAKLDPKVYTACIAHIDLTLDKVIDEQKLIYPMEDLEELMDGDVKAIFSNIEYVGLSNKIVQQEDRMNAICSQAAKHGTKLHTFGTASQSILKKWPIYSSNTSSWRTGSRYANTYIYEGIGRGLKLTQPTDKADLAKTDREKKNIRTRQKHAIEAKQPNLAPLINWGALIEEDDSWEVDKANLTQWILFQRDLALETKNAFWLTDEEKRELAEDKLELVAGKSLPSKEERTSVVGASETRNIGEIIEGELLPESTELVRAVGQRISKVDPRLLQPRMCDSCILANRCPKYNPGSSCAFGLTEGYNVAILDDHVKEDMGDLLAMQKDRILQGYLEEKADGAGLNKDLNRELKTYTEMLALYKQAMDNRDELSIKAKGTGLLQMFNKRGG